MLANPAAFRRIGEEVTERIRFTPGAFSVLRQVRGKYVEIDNPVAKPVIAPLPPCLLGGRQSNRTTDARTTTAKRPKKQRGSYPQQLQAGLARVACLQGGRS